MNWGWDPGRWKPAIKILIGIATIWPPIYMVLFFIFIFSMIGYMGFQERRGGTFKEIELIQLDRKIREGQIKELSINGNEVTAIERDSGIRYRVGFVNSSSQQEILNDAKQLDEAGQPRVARIEEHADSPPPAGLPFAIVGLFGAHMITILLMFALMPLYIILAVKNERLDQTYRIVWVVLMCTIAMFAAPVYWYLYIWRRPKPITTVEVPSVG